MQVLLSHTHSIVCALAYFQFLIIFLRIFLYFSQLYIMQLFSADAKIFKKKIKIKIFGHENIKKTDLKVAYLWQFLSIFSLQPPLPKTAQNWISVFINSCIQWSLVLYLGLYICRYLRFCVYVQATVLHVTYMSQWGKTFSGGAFLFYFLANSIRIKIRYIELFMS